MEKIKTLWGKLKGALQQRPKSTQGKAFVRVLQFFAVMVVLTIFARGTASVTMPRVTATTPFTAEITAAIDSTGIVVSQGSTDIELPAGLLVAKVNAPQGTAVKAGDTLVEFDADAIKDELVRQQMALKTKEIELTELLLPPDTDDKTLSDAQKALEKAQTAYDNSGPAYDTAAAEYSAALQTLDSRSAAYDAAATALAAEAGKPEGERDATLLAALEADNEAAYTAYEEALLDAQGKETARDTAKAEREGAAEALEDAQEALQEAQKAYQKAQQQQQIDNQKKDVDVTLKELEIENQKELVATLEKASGAGGAIKAAIDGTVEAIPLEEGESTTKGMVIRISTASDGYVVECQVPQKDSAVLKVGGTLSVKRTGAYYSADANIISKSAPNAEGMVTLRGVLPTDEWEAGEALEVQVITSRQQYNGNCVPLSAVHTDANGSYVYALREENTILGMQTVARRVEVVVITQDRTNAAVEGAWGELVLVSATKPVGEGDRVRVEDAI